MPQKIVQKSHVKRITKGKEYNYCEFPSETIDVTFTYNYNTAYANNLTFKKIKGGGKFGGNYICIEQSDEYRISKY